MAALPSSKNKEGHGMMGFKREATSLMPLYAQHQDLLNGLIRYAKRKQEDCKSGGANIAHQKGQTAHAWFPTLPASPSFGGLQSEPLKSGQLS